MEEENLREPTLEEMANKGRADIKPIELYVREMFRRTVKSQSEDAWEGQTAEKLAHIDLAIRALEDARMRLGKVLQYSSEDAVSVYDK